MEGLAAVDEGKGFSQVVGMLKETEKIGAGSAEVAKQQLETLEINLQDTGFVKKGRIKEQARA